jgi:glycosyltransferase involved in cell wall biosynthesis
VSAESLIAPEIRPALPEARGTVRVLHLHSGNMYGGVETLLATLARRRDLCPRMEPHFALCYDGRLSQELAAAGAPVHMLGRVRISRPGTVWNARRALRALLDRERFDAVIAHMIWPLAAFGGATRHSGTKLLFWAHSGHTGRPLLERIGRRTNPDRVIVNSQTVAASLSNIFPGVPSEVIFYPVDLVNRPADSWRTQVRRELKVDDRTTVIVQASRYEPWKGHLLHLSALARIPKTKNWTCWMVGGPQSDAEKQHFFRVRSTAAEYGISDRIQFLGHRSDVARLLAGGDIFCQPNLGPEPFGIIFVEALWSAKPVVTTQMGGALEILDSSCGLLVSPDSTALAKALEGLIDSEELRLKLGSAGPARARSLCDPASQMNRLAACIETAKAVG